MKACPLCGASLLISKCKDHGLHTMTPFLIKRGRVFGLGDRACLK